MVTTEEITKALRDYDRQQRERNLARTKRLAEEQGKTDVVQNITRTQSRLGYSSGSGGGGSSSYSSSEDLPIFTEFTTQPQSVDTSKVEELKAKTIKRGGSVVGIEDPVLKQSYAVAPTNEATIRKQEQERLASIERARTTYKAPVEEKTTVVGFEETKTTQPQSVISRATEKEKKTLRKTKLTNVFSNFFKGFVDYKGQLSSGVKQEEEIQTVGERRARETGAVGGALARIATFGKSPSIIGGGGKAYTAVKSTPFLQSGIGKFIASVPASYALGATGYYGTKKAGDFFLTDPEERYIKSKEAKELNIIGLKAQQEAIDKKAGVNIPLINRNVNLQTIGYGITQFAGDKDVYKQAVKQGLIDKGYNEQEVKRKTEQLLKKRNIEATAEIGGLIGTEIGGEVTGQGIFSSVAKKKGITTTAQFTSQPFLKKFGQGFISTAPAGFTEGATGYSLQRAIRGEKQDVKKTVTAGAFGAGFAGTLGGAIIATRGGTQTALRGVGYISDPYEAVGDVLGGQVIKGERAFIKTFTPTVSPVSSFSMTTTATQDTTPTSVEEFIQDKKPRVQKPTPITEFNIVPLGEAPVPNLNKPIIQPSFSIPSETPSETPSEKPSKTPSKTPSQTPTEVPTEIPIDNDIPVFNEVPTNVENIVNTPINTNTNVNVNVPTSTPIWRIPPPVPLGLNLGGGGGYGMTSKKGRTYVNELVAGREVLKAGLTVGVPQLTTKTKSGKSKPVPQPSRQKLNDFASFAFGTRKDNKQGAKTFGGFANVGGGFGFSKPVNVLNTKKPKKRKPKKKKAKPKPRKKNEMEELRRRLFG